jgi:alkylhydroperoxidase family enzyme
LKDAVTLEVSPRPFLQQSRKARSRFEVPTALDYCGHLCAATRLYAEALTIWAAYIATSRSLDSGDIAIDARRRYDRLRHAQQSFGAARARASDERGSAMSPAAAVEYALVLTSTHPQPHFPDPGSGQLSASERELGPWSLRGAPTPRSQPR